ncbi:MAG: NAD(P)-binding protein, partial [Actinomycetota bacterium]|nr:NAD(P)-binding protein [Actinomycetota bacterium]
MSEHESTPPAKPETTVEPATPGVKDTPTLIIGAGPAGLTAGYLLAKQGLPVIVFEAEDQVGGIAKTEVRDGPGGKYRFDLGGHRFFTKVKEVDDLWHEIMREEFLKRPRMSRIYWNKKFLDYPLRGPDVIKKLGPIELTRATLSY